VACYERPWGAYRIKGQDSWVNVSVLNPFKAGWAPWVRQTTRGGRYFHYFEQGEGKGQSKTEERETRPPRKQWRANCGVGAVARTSVLLLISNSVGGEGDKSKRHNMGRK